MNTIEQIYAFIEKECGCQGQALQPNADIFHDLGITGDDFFAFIASYSQKFQVNMDDYLWYFHSNEEGLNFCGLIFKPPNEKVKRIAVTPMMLLRFANSNRWHIAYPEHDRQTNRKDLVCNNMVYLLLLLFLLAFLL